MFVINHNCFWFVRTASDMMMVMVRPSVRAFVRSYRRVGLLLGARIKFWRVLKIYVIYMHAIPLLDFSVQLPLLLLHSLPYSLSYLTRWRPTTVMFIMITMLTSEESAHTHPPPTITLSAVYSWWTLLVWEFNLFRQSEQVKLIFLVCQVLVLFLYAFL